MDCCIECERVCPGGLLGSQRHCRNCNTLPNEHLPPGVWFGRRVILPSMEMSRFIFSKVWKKRWRAFPIIENRLTQRHEGKIEGAELEQILFSTLR